MFKKKKKGRNYRFYHKKTKGKTPSKLKEILILGLALFLLVYIFSLAKKLNQNQAQGKSESQAIRMQIVNGTKEKEAGPYVSSLLLKKSSDTLIFDILAIENLEDTALTPSLVLDRTKQGEKGEIVAQFLGISPSNLILKPDSDNYQGVDVTVILGNDYKKLFFPQVNSKRTLPEGKK
jgi:hypothetical protein